MAKKDTAPLDVVGLLRANVKRAEKVTSRRNSLETRKNELMGQVAEIDKEISEFNDELTSLSKGVVVKKRGRPAKVAHRGKKAAKASGKKMTLLDTIVSVMPVGKQMKVKDVAKAVLDAGYPTKIKNETFFASTISKHLREGKQFKKVGHGTFEYTGGAAKTSNHRRHSSHKKGRLSSRKRDAKGRLVASSAA